MTEHPSLPTIHLASFGFKYSGIPQDPSGHGGGFVFDCRSLPNPFWIPELRDYSGLDQPILDYMAGQPLVEEYLKHTSWLVLNAARLYREWNRERLMVSFGCTGGRHRSVYLATRMGRILEGEGYRVDLVHMDVNHPAEKEHNQKAPKTQTLPQGAR
ncbi:MAG: hypothetical protein OEW12_05250 [Deltaproteobacteria bacterium]|nr:hypothetical protein [Deltaproteobacteria bacterium]